MENQNSQHFLEDAEGSRVPVSDKVYRAYWRFTNKEDYFMRQLKEERFLYDPEKRIAEFIPSREDSLERIMEEGGDFVMDALSVEYQVELKILMETLMSRLTEDERQFLRFAFLSGLSEAEVSQSLKLSLAALRRKKEAFLGRCKRVLNRNGIFNDSS